MSNTHIRNLWANSLVKGWEVPAFAGMTNREGDVGRFQPSLESVQAIQI